MVKEMGICLFILHNWPNKLKNSQFFIDYEDGMEPKTDQFNFHEKLQIVLESKELEGLSALANIHYYINPGIKYITICKNPAIILPCCHETENPVDLTNKAWLV